MFAGTQRYAQERGAWECFVDETAHETLRGCTKKNRPYDGVLARATARLAEQAQRCRIPLVNVWYNSPARGVPGVFPDFTAAGRLAAEHLLGLGLRRFACVTSWRDRAHAVEVEAFHAAIAAAGCTCCCVKVAPDRAGGAEAWRRFREVLNRWMDAWSPPVGVYVALVDMTARHVMSLCQQRGLRVPGEVALIAGLNEPLLCMLPAPSLTSIEVNYEEMGYQAAR